MRTGIAGPGFVLESRTHGAVFVRGEQRLRVSFIAPDIARITLTTREQFLDKPSRIVIARREGLPCSTDEDEAAYVVSAGSLRVRVDKVTGALTYLAPSGEVLLREPERGGKWLTEKTVARNVFERDASVELGQSIDGARAVARNYTTVVDRTAYEAKLEFAFAEDQALFGLGSHEEGYANLRGRSRELYQQNMKAVVPHLVSTRGYGVLWDCGSLMTFQDDASGSYWWADCVDELDFYFMRGETHDDVIRHYRTLTGAPPLPPKWAFGYVQSKERYVTADEMLDVVAEYRRRQVPLDCIVLDWKSWPNGGGWGQKGFDAVRFPDPRALTEALHAMGARMMVSMWPIMTGGCENQRELLERGLMLGNQSTYDAFSSEAREVYWQQAERGLFAHGIDAWWCDCTEPFEADWAGAVKPEPHARLALNTGESKLYLDAGEINTYSLAHSQGIYEGQRATTDRKRVVNLTRSSYAGQSRYGTVTWNGDICATWETMRRSIAEGVNFCATGEPYWTVDIGGFFVGRRDDLWFWRGDYDAGTRGLTDMNALAPDPHDTGCTDLGFHELYTRWLEWAVFLPMFRSHGTDAAREIWRFGEPGSPFYDAISANIRLRYRLLPYIYSTAAAVTRGGASMVRAVALAFPADVRTHGLVDQYMFGDALMVCPVTQPMFYERNSQRLTSVAQVREVYLPASAGWFDFHTGEHHAGGQSIAAGAPLERIPVFVRAGSIVTMTEAMQFVDERRDAPYEVRVYTGAEAGFTIYEDDGDSYDYEQGECAHIALRWDEAASELCVGAREGSFVGICDERELRVIVFTPSGQQVLHVRYCGSELRIPFGAQETHA